MICHTAYARTYIQYFFISKIGSIKHIIYCAMPTERYQSLTIHGFENRHILQGVNFITHLIYSHSIVPGGLLVMS